MGVNVFMPGRLCLFGEHSDWASSYRAADKKIHKGYALVLGLDKGIYFHASKSGGFSYRFGDRHIVVGGVLDREAAGDPFFDYVISAARVMTQRFHLGGADIVCTDMTLPMKKGLASSAAVSMAVVRTYNLLYGLKLTVEEEMELAYEAEVRTGSKCGRMDQLCAYGKGIRLVEFGEEKLAVKTVNTGCDLHYLLVDLKHRKDTMKILRDLNAEYPFPKDSRAKRLYNALGAENEKTVLEAGGCMESGSLARLGELMYAAQERFDQDVAVFSSELTAPRLHGLMEHVRAMDGVLGAKGVGSQGDGMGQILVSSPSAAEQLKKEIEDRYGYETISVSLSNENPFAIIPLAGRAVRMQPASCLVEKSCLPVCFGEKVYPAIYVLVSELGEAGIGTVEFIIREDQRAGYEKIAAFLEAQTGVGITFSIQQRLGFGGALSSSGGIDGNAFSLVCLGDYIYRSGKPENCTQQLLNAWKRYREPMIGIKAIQAAETKNYGVVTGSWIDGRVMKVESITEKPDAAYAQKNLSVERDGRKEIYGIFGEYILDNEILRKIRNADYRGGELGLTEYLNENAMEYPMYAIVIEGESFDLGNPRAYYESFCRFGKE